MWPGLLDHWRRAIQCLPKSCLLCLGSIHNEHPICDGCLLDLPWIVHACAHCSLAVPADETSCRVCQQQRQPFARAVYAWHYDFPVNVLISRFKYNRQWPYGRMLAALLAQHLVFLFEETTLIKADCLIAVPLSARRQRERGYNQAHMIAEWLGRKLQIPVLNKTVARVRHTSIQQSLNARQRQVNMRNAFQVRKPQQVMNRHIALVDDVLTTGATCAELARELLSAGALRVDVYCLARTDLGRTGEAD